MTDDKGAAGSMLRRAEEDLAGWFWSVANTYGMTPKEFETLAGEFRRATENAIREARVRVLKRDAERGVGRE